MPHFYALSRLAARSSSSMPERYRENISNVYQRWLSTRLFVRHFWDKFMLLYAQIDYISISRRSEMIQTMAAPQLKISVVRDKQTYKNILYLLLSFFSFILYRFPNQVLRGAHQLCVIGMEYMSRRSGAIASYRTSPRLSWV